MSQWVKRIIIKSPLIPLFQRVKLLSPPFGKVRYLTRKPREVGRDFIKIFKQLKCYNKFNFYLSIYPPAKVMTQTVR